MQVISTALYPSGSLFGDPKLKDTWLRCQGYQQVVSLIFIDITSHSCVVPSLYFVCHVSLVTRNSITFHKLLAWNKVPSVKWAKNLARMHVRALVSKGGSVVHLLLLNTFISCWKDHNSHKWNVSDSGEWQGHSLRCPVQLKTNENAFSWNGYQLALSRGRFKAITQRTKTAGNLIILPWLASMQVSKFWPRIRVILISQSLKYPFLHAPWFTGFRTVFVFAVWPFLLMWTHLVSADLKVTTIATGGHVKKFPAV